MPRLLLKAVVLTFATLVLSGCLKNCPGNRSCPDNQFAALPAEAPR